jgi:c-di-GMP-binding flagellar brake protein YcgR
MDDGDGNVRLRVNDGIHIARILEGGNEDRQVHTYVDDIADSLMILPIPFASGVMMFFPVGAHLAVYLTRPDVVYRGESQVLRVFRKRRIPVMAVTVPESWGRAQRREDVRWECSLDVRWRGIDGREDRGRGITVNLSCGGMLCGSSQVLGIGRKYRFEIELSSGPLIADGVVVRIESDGQAEGSLWAVGFTRIAVRDQDRIVSFIFGEQLRLRRLGLL